MALTRNAILESEDLVRVKVPVPEWGGDVWVRMLSGLERDALEAAMLANPGQNVRGVIVAACACDEAGVRLFTDADAPAVGAKAGAALDRLFAKAAKLNRITRADVAELEGN